MDLLSVKDLCISFQLGEKQKNNKIAQREVVHGVSFSIQKGQCHALVGESGAGKSLTARSLMHLLPYGVHISSGSIFLEDHELTQLTEKEFLHFRGKDIAMVFQDSLAGLNPLQPVGKQVEEALFIHSSMNKKEREKRVLELFDLVQIDNAKERVLSFPHQLSGGQRQRVMLALAIANKPKLLIADEPTTALDANIQVAILELLQSLQKEFDMGLLLISHDLRMVQDFADVVHVMQKGNIVESSKELFINPQHWYTQKLLATEDTDYAPIQEKISEPILSVKNLNIKFVRPKKSLFKAPPVFHAVKNIDFTLLKGECLGLVGESGSGKSSIALAVLRLLSSKGSIILNGRFIENLSHKQMQPLRKKLQVVFQDPYLSLNPRMTIYDCIKEGVLAHENISKQVLMQKIYACLEDVGLSKEYALRFPHELSGGERQRVAIARAIILQPEVLILDEPTSSLDRTLQFQLLELLKELQKKYAMSFVYISHDLRLVKGFCQKILVLKQGECVEQGMTKDIFRNPQSDYMKRLLYSSNMQYEIEPIY